MPKDFCDQHPESQRLLEWFHNKSLLPNAGTLLVDLQLSHGPFLRLLGGQDLLDARGSAPSIGYNASPLFGTLHFLENWLGLDANGGDEARALRGSFSDFQSRSGTESIHTHQSAAATHRDYTTAFIGQQYSDQAQLLAESIAAQTPSLPKAFPDCIAESRFEDLTFTLHPINQSQRLRLLESRLDFGLLFDVCKSSFKFTLNYGFRAKHLEQFWQQLNFWLADSSPQPLRAGDSPKVLANYQFHQRLLEKKAAERKHSDDHNDMDVKDYLRNELHRTIPGTDFEVKILTAIKYPAYRQQILDMQAKVYEPARQTPAEEFDTLFDAEKLQFKRGYDLIDRPPLAIVILVENSVVAMAFAGPLNMFPETRGAATDPHAHDPTTYYMLDLTVIEEYRGKLGRLMKNALTLLASQTIASAIHGRNRDRLARGMWAINLSLGSYELQHLPNDYDDDHEHRDCIYYRCPLRWHYSQENWSRGIESPLDGLELDHNFFTSNMPTMANGQHESMTTSFKFIKELEYFAGHWPKKLRHVYATCNPDSAIKKLWKTIAPRRESEENQIVVALEGSDLGNFDGCKVIRIPNPCESGKAQYLEKLTEALNNESHTCEAVFIEPIISTTCDKLSAELLMQTKKLCRDAHALFVLIESASLAFRHSNEFAAGCIEGLLPDAAIANLGNSMSVVLGRKKWQPRNFFHGGEPLGLFGFNQLLLHISGDRNRYRNMLQQFDRTIALVASKASRVHVEGGIGWIEGDLKPNFENCLCKNDQGRYLVCPSIGQMMTLNEAIKV